MSRTLSEAASKELLAEFGVPFAQERLVRSTDEATTAGDELGFPVAAKLCGDNIAHKTERGLVRLGISDATGLRDAVGDLLAAATAHDAATGVLVAPMISGTRELIAGVSTDPQFGPTVLVGIGGVLAEAVADVAVRPAPISRVDAAEMLEQLRTQGLLGEFRGEPAVDREAVVDILMALSRTVERRPDIRSIDLNPLIIDGGVPVAVDALVEVAA
jgi:acetate---CoA ligase (ADP-forming) subunit beta